MRRFAWWQWLVAGGGLAVLAAMVFVLPIIMVPDDVSSSAARVVELRNSVRGTLVQLAGGALLVIGVVATWRQLGLYREGHITDRYTRAVEQLGAVDEHGQEKVDVQLGGIYALERLAHDSPGDRPTIVEVLSAFVRHRATRIEEDVLLGTPESLQFRLPTVQAALRVLGRTPRLGDTRLELADLHLPHADLRGANLTSAVLSSTNLSGSNLWGAKLAGADLQNADLVNALLADADLSQAWLGSDRDSGADLTEAILLNADLTGAQLSGTKLVRAYLMGADLTGVEISDTDLTGARFDASTRWPDGVDPVVAGAIHLEDHTGEEDS